MAYNSNFRSSEITGANPVTITNEAQVVVDLSYKSAGSRGVLLSEAPLKESPSTIVMVVGGTTFTEVDISAFTGAANTFAVEYASNSGVILLPPGTALGTATTTTYKGLGTVATIESKRFNPDGTAAAPSISFESDPDTGIAKSPTPGGYWFVSNGVTVASVSSGGIGTTNLAITSDGTAAAPSLFYQSDPDTGLYRIGANEVGMAANGALVGRFNTSGISSPIGINPPMLTIVDQKAAGTNGGSFTSGEWRTRDLNTIIGTNGITGASLATNQITLPAGSYFATVKSPAYAVGIHKCKLYNITDASDTLIGSTFNANAADVVSQASEISAPFTIADTKVFEVQHRCTVTNANGFGIASGFTTPEIYTIVNLWKLS